MELSDKLKQKLPKLILLVKQAINQINENRYIKGGGK
jgi:hypothetical protein